MIKLSANCFVVCSESVCHPVVPKKKQSIFDFKIQILAFIDRDSSLFDKKVLNLEITYRKIQIQNKNDHVNGNLHLKTVAGFLHLYNITYDFNYKRTSLVTKFY